MQATRNLFLNNQILEKNTNGVCIVGAEHISHIITDRELSEQYKFVSFETTGVLGSLKATSTDTLKDKKTLISQLKQKFQTLSSNEQEQEILQMNDTIEKTWNDARHLLRQYDKIIPLYLNKQNCQVINNNYCPMVDVLDIAINVIDKHNNKSNFSDLLKKKKAWCQKLDDITFASPWFEQHYVSHLINQNNVGAIQQSLEQNILSQLKKFDQLSVIHPDVDLIGNWDVGGDC